MHLKEQAVFFHIFLQHPLVSALTKFLSVNLHLNTWLHILYCTVDIIQLIYSFRDPVDRRHYQFIPYCITPSFKKCSHFHYIILRWNDIKQGLLLFQHVKKLYMEECLRCYKLDNLEFIFGFIIKLKDLTKPTLRKQIYQMTHFMKLKKYASFSKDQEWKNIQYIGFSSCNIIISSALFLTNYFTIRKDMNQVQLAVWLIFILRGGEPFIKPLPDFTLADMIRGIYHGASQLDQFINIHFLQNKVNRKCIDHHFFCVAMLTGIQARYVCHHSPLYTFIHSFFPTEYQTQVLFSFQPFSAINVI